jgi:hypothetical protein
VLAFIHVGLHGDERRYHLLTVSEGHVHSSIFQTLQSSELFLRHRSFRRYPQQLCQKLAALTQSIR